MHVPRPSRPARADGDPEALSAGGDTSAVGGGSASAPSPVPASAPTAVLLLLRRRLLLLMKPVVVFVLGGPGAGKGTQCARIVEVRAVERALHWEGGGRGVFEGLHIPACPRAGLRGALQALPRGTLGVVGCRWVRPRPPPEARGRWLPAPPGAEPKGRGAGWRWVATLRLAGLEGCALCIWQRDVAGRWFLCCCQPCTF